jgi:hypothetical protein
MAFTTGDMCISPVMVLKNSFPEISKNPHFANFILLIAAFRAGVSQYRGFVHDSSFFIFSDFDFHLPAFLRA